MPGIKQCGLIKTQLSDRSNHSSYLGLAAFFLISLLLTMPAAALGAGDFKTDSSTTYELDGSGQAKVIIAETLENIGANTLKITRIYTIPAAGVATIAVQDEQGRRLNRSIRNEGQYCVVSVPIEGPIHPGAKASIKITYDQTDVAKKYGRIWEILTPGFVGEEGTTNHLTIRVPRHYGGTLFTDPPANNTSQDELYWVFDYSQESVQDKVIWMEFGDYQVIGVHGEFGLPPVGMTMDYYRISLPRDTQDGVQQVVIRSIDPEPLKIETDKEGNYYAVFEQDSLTTGKASYDAYAVLRPIRPESADAGIGPANLDDYIASKKFWEADEPKIVAAANEAAAGAEGDEAIGRKLYQYVIDMLEYDEAKIDNNTRLGALEALNRRSGVCMEYADLFIALCRSKGIPARSVFGFAYDFGDYDPPDNGHEWTQIYLQGRGWVTVDPTWGEIGRDYYGQPSLSHTVMVVSGKDPQLYSYVHYGNMPIDAEADISSVPTTDEVAITPGMDMNIDFPQQIEEESSESLTVKIANTGNVSLHDVEVSVDPGGFKIEESSKTFKNIPPYSEATAQFTVISAAPGTGRLAISAQGRELGGQVVKADDIIGVAVTEKILRVDKVTGWLPMAGLAAFMLAGAGILRKLWMTLIG